MKYFTVVLLGLFAATATVLAGPQRVEEEAEVVGDGGTSAGEGSDEGVFLYFPGFGDIRGILRNIFGRRRTNSEGDAETGLTEGSNGGGGLFSTLFGGGGSAFDPFFTIFRPTNYTVTFSNSSLEVVNYGRVPMLVNKTIEQRKGEDGSVYYSVVQTLLGPYDNSTGLNVTGTDFDYPAAADEASTVSTDETLNAVEEPSTRLKHTLTKRWIASWLRNKLAKRGISETETSRNHLTTSTNKLEEKEEKEKEEEKEVPENSNSLGGGVTAGGLEKEGKEEDERPTGNAISYIGDTDVNYLNRPRNVNPDAEVFDPELVRRGEDEFLERRLSSPISPESLRARPLRSQPMSSHPPTNSHPLSYIGDTDVNYLNRPRSLNPDAEVFNTELIRRGEDEFLDRRFGSPVTSQPPRSQPLRARPLRSQPLRAQPLRSQPISSHPVNSHHLRSQPLSSQPLTSHPRRSQPLRYKPLNEQPPHRYQPLLSRPLRERHVRL